MKSSIGTILDIKEKMRQLFFVITVIYLLICLTGIIAVGTRLTTIKEKTELLSEAQRSLLKRSEFKGIIFELRRAIEKKREPEIGVFIKRSTTTIRECYGCHHPDHIKARIIETENRVNELASSLARSKDYKTLLAITERIIPFVETAYEKATSLSKERLDSSLREIKRTEKAIKITVISGIMLFLTITIIALYRISHLQRNIRERERSLENWANQWQKTFDSIQDCLMIVDEEGRIKMANRSTETIFIGPVKGRSIMEIIELPSPENGKKLYDSSSVMEFSKEEKVFQLKSYPHCIEADRRGYIIVIRDVTAEKEMEQRSIQAEKLSTLSRIMATVATELYNPVTSVSEYSKVLLDLSSINKRIREIADKISMSTSRMSGIVGELLHISKVPQLNKRSVESRTLIEGILRLIKESVDLGNIRLIVESEKVNINVDMVKAERAVLSLIMNSINRLNLSGHGDMVSIKGYVRGGRFHIDIYDNGPLIPKEASLKLFEPFFTEEGEKKNLDLNMSYNIIRAHGGDIIIRSSKDKTVFSVELPL